MKDMKKILEIPVIAAISIAAVACSKTVNPAAAPEEGEPMELCATLGQAGTKTHLGVESGGQIPVCWDAEDLLWVSSNTTLDNWAKGSAFSTSADAISADGQTATFKGIYRKDGKGMVAVYPYEYVQEKANWNKLTIDIPGVQKYNPTNCPERSIVAAAYWSEGNDIRFSYVVGCLKLSLKGNAEAVGKLVIMDNNTSNLLWGTCQIKPNDACNAIGQVTLKSGNNSLAVECPTPVILGPTASDFYLTVPGGSFASGMTVALYDSSNNLIKAFKTTKNNAVAAGMMIVMPEADIKDFASVDPSDFPVSSSSFSGGQGTEDDPYIIGKAADIAQLAEIINTNNGDSKFNGKDVYYVLSKSIDMAGTEFDPIGKQKGVCEFKANFDGAGYTISNAAPTDLGDDYGIWGSINGGSVRNLTIENFNNAAKAGSVRTGSLAGSCTDATITDCKIAGTMVIRTATSGGLVGALYGCTVSGCECAATITNDGSVTTESGGLFGYVDASGDRYTTISDCKLSGSVTLNSGKNFIGGLVGYLFRGSLSNSTVDAGASVVATGNSIGGLVARTHATAGETPSTVSGCTFNGSVSGVSGVGGIIGGMYGGQVIDCSSPKGATITGTDYSAGGITGRVYECANCGEVLFDNCMSNCDITGPSCIGAMTGSYKGAAGTWLHIRNCGCQSSGKLTGNGIYNNSFGIIGGLIGWMYTANGAGEHIIENCYSWSSITQTSTPPNSSIGGIIGLVNGNGGTIRIFNCYSWLSSNRVTRQSTDDKIRSIVGDATDANKAVVTLDYCYDLNESYSGGSVYGNVPTMETQTNYFIVNGSCESLAKVNDPALQGKLNDNVTASDDAKLRKWILNSSNYPYVNNK